MPGEQKSSFTSSLTVNDEIVDQPVDISEEFNTYFVNIAKRLADKLRATDDTNFMSYLKHPTLSSKHVNPTDSYEIVSLINSLQLNKANGFNISAYFLNVGADILAYPITDLFNHCISLGIFPQQLKIAKVIPVYKSSPPDNVGNCRSISLLTSPLKIFERLIFKRMILFFNKNNNLISTQFGFRLHHSTIHSIWDIITSCYDSLQLKDFVNLMFLDIKKAFDSVSHFKLLKKLEHYGIRGVANQLLESYLTNRMQFVSIGNVN